jgi:NAD(P)-dependent dehydrogenase (short-subunit alcohol dehydrogenase family)
MTKVALVTGASRGIGRQTAVVLAREGWDVAFTARTVEEGTGTVPARHGEAGVRVEGSLATTAALVEREGARALPVAMDLLDLASVRAAATTVLEQWGRVDLLVNNAIAHVNGGHERVLAQDLGVAAAMMTGNYLHQLALVQAVLPGMVERGAGTIVQMASGSATTDPPAPPDEGGWGLSYAASKAAVGRLAGAVNAEYLSRGIRAFNVDPGFVVTEAMRARGGAEDIEDKGFDLAPDDAAGRVIAWLARDPGADRFLGRVIWSPKLAAAL